MARCGLKRAPAMGFEQRCIPSSFFALAHACFLEAFCCTRFAVQRLARRAQLVLSVVQVPCLPRGERMTGVLRVLLGAA